MSLNTRQKIVSGLVAVTLAAVGLSSTSSAGPADDRFEQLDGPLASMVVRPAGFGMDPSRTLIDVAPLLDRVDGDRAMGFVESLSFPRTADGPEQARQDARDLVTGQLIDAGYEPQFQSVLNPRTQIDSPNIYVDLPGTECPGKMLIIGGHYDSAHPQGPGADDNATGVAGMLEIARALRDTPLPVTVRFASWSYEEIGLVGSDAMARQLKAENADVVGAVSLEMIGFTKAGIDPLTGLTNDYLAFVADPTSSVLAKTFGAAAYRYTPEFAAAGAVVDPALLGDILRSDHAAFLNQGYPALLGTDTADFRNPNYHQPSDTPASLDKAFLTNSIRASLAGLLTYGSSDQDSDGRSDLCHQPVTTVTTSPTSPPTTAATKPQTVAPAPKAAAATPRQARPAYTG